MADLETVIKSKEHLDEIMDIATHLGYPEYGVVQDHCLALLELLKGQEHGETFTVIDTKTGKEADEYAIALHEDWAKHLCYCDMEGWAIENDGTLLLVDECGKFAYADRERFKVVWDA